MGSVFISYRRDDSRDVCRVLAGALMARLGRRNVFLDVDSIAGGELFPRRLEEALRASVVVLVVIGPRWLTAADDHGLRRLDNPADFVRREIELALDSGATVLPLLVHGAAQPAAHDLPPSLQPLAALTPLALHDDPAGAPDLASAIRTIRRVALEADLRRLPRVASPLLAILAAAALIAGVPYVASQAQGYHWFGTSEATFNNYAACLTGWTPIIAVILMIRGRQWAWLAALVIIFTSMFVVQSALGKAASDWMLLPLALCAGLFGLTGRRFSLLFAARRLRRQGA